MEGIKPPKVLNLNGNIAEDWRRFRQNFEIFLKAGDHAAKATDVQVAILLNCVGEEAVELFNTFQLTETQKKNLTDVIAAFEEYANPRRNIVVERYMFNCRNQEHNEKFDEFLTDLRKLIKHCEYGTLTDSILRDRVVLGTSDKQIQERLLRESELTLQKTIEICRASELSKIQSEVIQRKTELNAVTQRSLPGASTVSLKPKTVIHQTGRNNAARKINSSKENVIYLCKKCGNRHAKANCPAYGKVCNSCQGLHHFEIGCMHRNKNSKFKNYSYKNRNFKVNDVTENVIVDSVYNKNRNATWILPIQVGQKTLNFKLDTGSGVNILPNGIFKKLNCNNFVRSTNLILEAYGGSQIKPLGVVNLDCKLGNTEKCLEFVIVDCKQNSGALLGLSSCEELGLIKRQEILNIEIKDKNSFINENKDVFEGLGKFNFKCSIKIDENAEPIARPPRRVPETIKVKLKDKLNDLEKNGVISKVQNPDGWISNLVIVEKTDGSIRVCLDPQDLNKVIKKEYYLIPTVDELLPKLCNKTVYSVFDLKDGFYQIELDEKSSTMCQFSTPFGVYKFNRLPFGVSVAPQLFQKFNEKNFGDIPGVLIYFDDMLIYANDEKEHDSILHKVVERARKLNVKFNKNKLQFRVNEVKYLGHIFNKNGMKPDPEQVKAILNLQTPSNKKELLRILGMINYLRNFIPNMSETTAPLRELLKTSVQFNWLPIHTQALNELKVKVSKAPVLANFDSNKQIVLQCDSSKSGLGCCLLQDGQPVGFASRALSEAEQNYAQIEKEYLSIVFATKKFHNFIYGRKVTVQTDHKPLVSIHKKYVVNVISSRLQRMKLKLLKYDLDIIYVPGKHMYVADLLSRSYINETDDDDHFIKEIIHCVKATRHLQVTDNKLKQFKECTLKDPVLNKLVYLCKNGWPDVKKDVSENVRFYFKLRQDLFEEDGLVFLNNKIVVPRDLQKEMLNKIHEGHFGMEKCKSRARQIFYWPGMLNDIENLVAKCSSCEKFRSKNCKESLISHEILSLPFEKVGCDICEFGKMDYLVLVDYLTKWLEIVPIVNKQAGEIINSLKVIFSIHGIPRFLVADNMPFNSKEFRKFACEWDFEIINSSPRYPKSNGQAESGVKIAKNILKKCYDSNQDIYTALMEYRNTPIKGLEISPSQALMSKRNRTKIPINRELLKPEVQSNVRDKIINKQQKSKLYYDKSAKPLDELSDHDNVLIRSGNKWERGKIIRKDKMPRSYWVKNENNRIVRRNRVHLRKSFNEPNFKREIEMSDSVGNDDVTRSSNVHSRSHNNNQSYITRFGRTVKPPERYGLTAK